jgi:hypothetical protein
MGSLPSALLRDFEVIAPVDPGFAGTPRPEWYAGIDDIALSYLQLLEQLDLQRRTPRSFRRRHGTSTPPTP